MTKLKWLTNAQNPKHFSKDDLRPQEHRKLELLLESLEGKIIGKPKATKNWSVEGLEAMGMIGVYKEVADETLRQDP